MEKYIEKLRIKSYYTNQSGQLSVASLINFLFESAWAHAQVMEWGYDQLKSNNLFWVLSRMYVEIEKYPEWKEEIVLNTWSAGTDGMYAYREFILENMIGEVVAKASTSWLILDLDTKKIFLLREYRTTFPKLVESKACRHPQKLRLPDYPEEMDFYPVQYSDLDVNDHFNSSRYVDRMLNGFGIDFLRKHELATVEVNYLKEGMASDFFKVVTQQLNDGEYLSGVVRESDKAFTCSMQTSWRERS